SILALLLLAGNSTSVLAQNTWGQTFDFGAPAGAGNPNLAASGNNVYVVWNASPSPSGPNEVYMEVSHDTGTTFGPRIDISNDPSNSIVPLVAASGNNVYVAWDDNATGKFNVVFRVSHDGGNTFSSMTTLSATGTPGSTIQLLASKSSVYLFWH